MRYPGWAAAGGLRMSVNGEPVADAARTPPGQYAEVRREWKQGDVLTVDLPMQVRTEPMPDAEGFAAIFYGPVLIAGDLGREGLKDDDFLSQRLNEQKEMPVAQVPVLLATAGEIPGHVSPVAGEPLTFRLQGIVTPVPEVTLRPSYALTDRRYAFYWRLTTPEKRAQEARALEAAEQHERELDARSSDHVFPGEQQPEVDHKVQSEHSTAGMAQERRYRDAWSGGWFSYELAVPPDQPVKLRCTYWGDEQNARRFDILVDGQTIASQVLQHNQPGRFFDVEYPIPAELTGGKTRVTVKFQAEPHGAAGGVFDLRVMRQDTRRP